MVTSECACAVSDKGQKASTEGDDPYWTNVQITIDEDYACTLFQSCKKESFISLSGIDSSIQFLDFLGSNGAPYSLSYINFTFDTTETDGNSLKMEAYPCDYPVPENGELYSYTGIYNSSCSYCQNRCEPPVVNDHIGFLDGLSWKIVGWSYFSFIIFIILYQVAN